MNREFLKELGLEDEAINKIMAEHGKTVNELKDTNQDLEAKYETTSKQLKAFEDEMKEFEGLAETNQDLKAQLEKTNKTMEQLKEESQEEIFNIKFDSTLKNTLLQTNAYDVNDILNNLDKDILKMEEDKILGLDEQLENLKENKPYLFKEEGPKGTGGSLGNGAKPKSETEDPFLKGLGLE